ncbi:MAG: aminotransferase class I/II-fold pyridoxal phosphate-dependent enzyme [Bacteroidota bacterium]
MSIAALSGSVARFARPRGVDLLARTQPFHAWHSARTSAACWSYSRSLDEATGPTVAIRSECGQAQQGINFASQDYLGLSAHPAVHEAVSDALAAFGPHSAGSPMLLGNTALSLDLEREIADALHMAETVLFPTGWAAGFGAIVGLVRPYDHVVMDELVHACLQQGAYAATRNVHRHRHGSAEHVENVLAAIRAQDSKNGVLVITEGLFSMDSDTPDLARLQALCHDYDATLLVDIAHDFGSLGPDGTGSLGLQGLLGEVDLVMGSFSKTFASNGGFVAVRDPAVKHYLKIMGGPHIFSNALSPLQCAAVQAALRIVRSEEGAARRASLLRAVTALRGALADEGIACLGAPSAIVPVPIGERDVARIAAKLIAERGVLANLVEYPAVPEDGARFRMQAMATHTPEQAREAAAIVSAAIADAQNQVAGLKAPGVQAAA